MEKAPPSNQKIRANKPPKNKKTKPLKVVYIANPVKFNASASEFRALVQELTGQDAAADGGGEAAEALKVAAEGNVHAEEEGTEIGQHGEVGQKGSDPSVSESYNDAFVSPHEMMESSYQGMMGSNLLEDVFKNLGAM